MTKLICVLATLLVVGGCSSASSSHVSPAQLLASPHNYDNEQLKTVGHVILGDGMCTLIVADGPSAANRVAVGDTNSVWLSSGNKLCAAGEKTITCANVSGIFTVLRPRDGKPEAYVFRHANVEPTTASCDAPTPDNSVKQSPENPRAS